MSAQEELVTACPHCDTARTIYRRSGRGNAYRGDPTHEWYCWSCKETFEEPRRRPPHPNARDGGPPGVSDEQLDRIRKKMGIEVNAT